jgi:hypothetical protein
MEVDSTLCMMRDVSTGIVTVLKFIVKNVV